MLRTASLTSFTAEATSPNCSGLHFGRSCSPRATTFCMKATASR